MVLEATQRPVVLLDNRDSFTGNLRVLLAQLLGKSAPIIVLDSYRVSANDLMALQASAVVLSPGPGSPRQAGCLMEAVEALVESQTPTLGVCLGHQALGEHAGMCLIRASEPMHGRCSIVQQTTTKSRLLSGLPRAFRVVRYHSLTLTEVEQHPDWRASAYSPDGALMAMEHVSAPFFGVQFHPESVLTQHGAKLMANFLRTAGLALKSETEVTPPLAVGALKSWARSALHQHPPGPPMAFPPNK